MGCSDMSVCGDFWQESGTDYAQFILSVEGDVTGDIYCESKVTSTVKASLVAIDKNCGFIVDGSKVE